MRKVSINSASLRGSDLYLSLVIRILSQFPLIPLPRREATATRKESVVTVVTFPLIPLPRREATTIVTEPTGKLLKLFPLIPLPRREATLIKVLAAELYRKFPLIPLPRREATLAPLPQQLVGTPGFH